MLILYNYLVYIDKTSLCLLDVVVLLTQLNSSHTCTTADDGCASGTATQKEYKEIQGGRKKPPFRPTRNTYQKITVPRHTNFEGKCDEINGHIKDYSDAQQSDLFVKTTKEVAC